MTTNPETAIAILFSGTLDGSKHSCDVFREGECGQRADGSPVDPQLAAEALRESCEADFPERLWAVAPNDRAIYLMTARRLRDWGLEPAEAVDA